MEWLLLFACPLMMLLCMKGMMGGKKDCKTKTANVDGNKTADIQLLQVKMNELVEQNNTLAEEVKALKEQKSDEGFGEIGQNQNLKNII